MAWHWRMCSGPNVPPSKNQALLAPRWNALVSFRGYGKGDISITFWHFPFPLSTIFSCFLFWRGGCRIRPGEWRIIPLVPLPFIMLVTLKKHQTIVTWPSEILFNRDGTPIHVPRWWFQTFFIFTASWGRFPFWRSYSHEAIFKENLNHHKNWVGWFQRFVSCLSFLFG